MFRAEEHGAFDRNKQKPTYSFRFINYLAVLMLNFVSFYNSHVIVIKRSIKKREKRRLKINKDLIILMYCCFSPLNKFQKSFDVQIN